MKVTLDGAQLLSIGKTLTPQQTQGGWYLSAIDQLAKSGVDIHTTNIQGETWAELDTPEDYEICRELFGSSEMARNFFIIKMTEFVV